MTDRAHLAYTLALHKAVAPDPAVNVCWSPFSVASALGLVAHGAHGTTRDELALLLLGDKSGDLVRLGELLARAGVLDPPRGKEDEPVIAVSNTLWVDESIEILAPYIEELGRWSSGKTREAPFREAPGEARDRINVDVAKTTRDLIPELIPADAITEDTRSALVNALYLKCGWRFPFTEGATRPQPFHTPGGPVDVPTMVAVRARRLRRARRLAGRRRCPRSAASRRSCSCPTATSPTPNPGSTRTPSPACSTPRSRPRSTSRCPSSRSPSRPSSPRR